MPEPTDPLRRKALLEFWRFCFGWAPEPDWEWLEAMESLIRKQARKIEGQEDA